MRRVPWGVWPGCALALFSLPARAFDAARCDNDTDPVPGFAMGRDLDGCLLINPGTGAASIRFDWEGDSPDELVPPSDPACTTNDCAMVLWNVNADDYTVPSDGSSGGDAFHFAGRRYRYVLWKNFGAGNTFKCKGGMWTSPTGLQTCSGETSSGHVDAIQIRGQPVGDGWAVMQDSTIANANDIHVILEMNTPEYVGPAPGFVFQNVRVGYFPDWGAADDWTQDCIAMGGNQQCGPPVASSPRWQVGSNNTETSFKATWLINSWSHVRVEADRTLKLIVVNGATGGGCDNVDGCNGTIGFENGWPAPLGHAISSQGPGVCPEGLLTPGDIRSAGGVEPVPVYCYTSIEAALSDEPTTTAALGDCPDCPHDRPPFVHLSCSGWAEPPSGCGGGSSSGSGGMGGSNGGGGLSGTGAGAGGAAHGVALMGDDDTLSCGCVASGRTRTKWLAWMWFAALAASVARAKGMRETGSLGRR
jgi:hypothetical protein